MKPIILGVYNPHSRDPAMALATDPQGASGYRLWQMLKEAGNRNSCNITERDYLDGFERRNLWEQVNLIDKRFDRSETLAYLARRVVVMCGTKVPTTLGLRHTGFHCTQQHAMSFIYYVIPHPSGLCREYNDPKMRERVGNLLWRLLQ